MVQWMNLHRKQQYLKSDTITFAVRKIWSHTPSASGSYGRSAGQESDEILVDLEILKITILITSLGFSWRLTKGTVLLQYYQ